jgi:hypothetical protein
MRLRAPSQGGLGGGRPRARHSSHTSSRIHVPKKSSSVSQSVSFFAVPPRSQVPVKASLSFDACDVVAALPAHSTADRALFPIDYFRGPCEFSDTPTSRRPWKTPDRTPAAYILSRYLRDHTTQLLPRNRGIQIHTQPPIC